MKKVLVLIALLILHPSFLRSSEARWYDPETGKWTTRDPLEEVGDPNLYRLVGNNPVNFIDPFGFSMIDASGYRNAKDQLLGWAPNWAQDILMPLDDISIGPLAMTGRGAKSAEELAKHLENLNVAKKLLQSLQESCPKGKKAQEILKDAIRDIERQIKGHEKEIRQKWPGVLP